MNHRCLGISLVFSIISANGALIQAAPAVPVDPTAIAPQALVQPIDPAQPVVSDQAAAGVAAALPETVVAVDPTALQPAASPAPDPSALISAAPAMADPVAVLSNETLPAAQPTVTPPETLPAGAQAVTSGTQITGESEGAAELYLNFDNASILSVINYLGEQKKANIIPHKELEGVKLTLSSKTPITLKRAWDVVLTSLELNGFSMIDVNGIFRIVQNANNGQEPLPFYSSAQGTEPESLPDSDVIIRYAYFLKNIKTDAAVGIVSKFLDEKSIMENKDLNVLIIKDAAINIKNALAIIKELDAGGMAESMELLPLKWTSAENVKKLFDEIIGQENQEKVIRFNTTQKEASFFAQNTKILKDDIHNSLILLGTPKNITRIKEFVAKYIDIPIENAESRLHIKELSFMPAADMKAILDDIIKPPSGTTTSEKSLVIEGGYKTFEDVVITAEQDESGEDSKFGSGNRLIIAANREDWARIESFINMLDKPQPQVAIEIMIVDVNMRQIRSLGANIYGIKGNPLGKNINVEFTNVNPGAAPRNTTGNTSDGDDGGNSQPSYNPEQSYLSYLPNETGSPSIITLGKAPEKNGDTLGVDNVWAYLRAVMNLENNQVVSQPYIVVNNNKPGKFSTEVNLRVKGKIDARAINAVQAIENVTAKIEANITPRINLAGIVDLSVDLTIDEFTSTDLTSDQPEKTKRHITTKSKLGVGEVLIIGGLTNSRQSEVMYNTPVLSSIPILGNFFKSKRKDKQETNIYVFIRPSIIKPKFEGNPDEYTQLKLDYAKYQLMKNDSYVDDKDPIQRWFFKPSHQTIKQKVDDYSKGILRPIDNFTYGKSRPVTVNLQEDPFFSVSEAINQAKETKKQSIIKQ